MTNIKTMLNGWLLLIITHILASVAFYSAEYIVRHWVFTVLGVVAVSLGWYNYGVIHGRFLERNSRRLFE